MSTRHGPNNTRARRLARRIQAAQPGVTYSEALRQARTQLAAHALSARAAAPSAPAVPTRIVITRVEGPVALLGTVTVPQDHEHGDDSWQRADTVLATMATTAPTDGSYHKCDIVIWFHDDEDSYPLRYGLTSHPRPLRDEVRADIASHLAVGRVDPTAVELDADTVNAAMALFPLDEILATADEVAARLNVDTQSPVGVCPLCEGPRPYPLDDDGCVFLPGSVCPRCHHREPDTEMDTGDGRRIDMDRAGTVRWVDEDGNVEAVATLVDDDWDRLAAPLGHDRARVAAALAYETEARDADCGDGPLPFTDTCAFCGRAAGGEEVAPGEALCDVCNSIRILYPSSWRKRLRRLHDSDDT